MNRYPIQQTAVNYEAIHKAISTWTTAERTTTLAKSLWKHFEKSEVQGFRVSLLFGFVNDDRSWPVIEWKQNNDKQFLALFHFDDRQPLVECSWLVHYGAGTFTQETGWAETAVAWGVTDMSHLKTLFGAARHFLGVLEWDYEVALKLYCGIEGEGPSDQEYVTWRFLTCSMHYYAKLLYQHIHEIELLEAEFERIAPILLQLNREEGSADSNASKF